MINFQIYGELSSNNFFLFVYIFILEPITHLRRYGTLIDEMMENYMK